MILKFSIENVGDILAARRREAVGKRLGLNSLLFIERKNHEFHRDKQLPAHQKQQHLLCSP